MNPVREQTRRYCFIVSLLTIACLFITNPKNAQAVYDPLSVNNNKIGIHILFPDEITKAKDLVNTSGGDWGYVTIPIQAGDKDIKKWQNFLDNSRNYHLIPIFRLATEGNYFDKSTWRKPKDEDIIDFANFLNSLSWPVKNRYILVFNEVNRADEWAGQANPEEYAKLLSYTVTVFKSKNPDYFIISSGLDNAAQSNGKTYNEYDFLDEMNISVPGIFNQIDGVASHSYPNPAFKQPPSVETKQSITSFRFEQDEIRSLGGKPLPVFITETGWDQHSVGEETAAKYFKESMENVWNDPNVVAITPFLLKAGPGPFEKFSFIKGDGDKSEAFKSIENLSKTKGTPSLYPVKKILGTSTLSQKLPVKDFTDSKDNKDGKILKVFVKWMLFGI